MWQRIQTVFLVITVVALVISLVQPIWISTDNIARALTPFYYVNGDTFLYMPYSITAVIGIASITVSIMEIRRYDNRMVQIKLGALNSVLLAGMMICAVWFANKVSEQHAAGFKYGWGLYMIFVAVICNWLAIRFIRRDERLVRDSDRLR
jgi:Kef-type K+ transport system membrane component KefB